MSVRSEHQPATVKSAADARPKLLFFCTDSSGSSRRVEGFLAQVLQRRQNHDTFELRRIDYDTRTDLAQLCGVHGSPALVVVENKRVHARIEQPRGCKDIQEALAPWLR